MFNEEDDKIKAIETIIKDLTTRLATVENFDTQYFQSYFEFLKFFKEKNEITDSDFIISAHFTYGWMPTIPSIVLDKKI